MGSNECDCAETTTMHELVDEAAYNKLKQLLYGADKDVLHELCRVPNFFAHIRIRWGRNIESGTSCRGRVKRSQLPTHLQNSLTEENDTCASSIVRLAAMSSVDPPLTSARAALHSL